MTVAVPIRAYVPWSVADSLAPRDADPLPSVTHEDLRDCRESRDLQARERMACSRSPWYWLVNYVVTEDARWVGKGLGTAYQLFPPLAYLQSVTDTLWRYPLMAIPKSRQMVITWLVSAYMLGDALFTGGRLYMIQSKKEEDAAAVLARQMGTYERLRGMAPWMAPGLVIQNDTHVRFTNGSELRACPQGAHHVQSYTPAWLFLDEIQLQDEAEAAYHQALPACEHITLVGSAETSWFWTRFLPDDLSKGA